MMMTMMVPIKVMRIVVMMIIMNSNELWQNGFYVDDDDGSTADYDKRVSMGLTDRRKTAKNFSR